MKKNTKSMIAFERKRVTKTLASEYKGEAETGRLRETEERNPTKGLRRNGRKIKMASASM